ncbi:MAG: hypothetical protein K6U87_17425, partial [Firmicutes bacterium]|nr:hypothetical protein [Bacillota bacterium]
MKSRGITTLGHGRRGRAPRWLVAVAAVGLLSACGSTPGKSAAPASTAPSKAASQGQLTIPVLLPLTGGGAFLGQKEQQALEILQTEVNQQGGVDGRTL